MGEDQHVLKGVMRLAGLTGFLTFLCPSLVSAGVIPAVSVGIAGTLDRLKLTFHVEASKEPVSITIHPGAVRDGAGLAVEHIAVNGTRKTHSVPTADWWLAKSQTLRIESRELSTQFSVWVQPGVHLDLSQPGIYRISYVHPWSRPDDGSGNVCFRSNTLVLVRASVGRSDELYGLLRQDPQLALATYHFQNPPAFLEYPKYWRSKFLNGITPTLRGGVQQDEVLFLLGSPDRSYSPSPGERKIHDYDEAWSYETSPVGEFIVRFRNGCVVDCLQSGQKS